ncbi:MAG: DUF4157 domain-containing protein [Acidobacteriota bacterium]|nr:DUF4157 domain-containing protein [Acidobacteriota bacterium]
MKTLIQTKGKKTKTVNSQPVSIAPIPAGRAAIRNVIGNDLIQTDLKVGAPDDAFEREADHTAEQVMRMPDTAQPPPISGGQPGIQRVCDECEDELQRKSDEEEEEEIVQTRTESGTTPKIDPGTESAIHAQRSGGRPLDATTRAFFEPRFGYDFSNVRIHSGEQAASTAESLNARAYTLGRDIVFGRNNYAPQTEDGKRLLAHELTHVVQQGKASSHPGRSSVPGEAPNRSPEMVQMDRYTPEERRAMVEGRVTPTADDNALATRLGFQPGDIVFRLGSTALAGMINNPVTHGGIYLGNGLIHDMVGFGNRTVRATLFYEEAADASVVRIIRFIGPEHQLIISRLLENIQARDFNLPTDPIPWNLFSTATDYRTATCLEYSHAQFLYAIQELSGEASVPQATRTQLAQTYFASGGSTPDPLISPQSISQSVGYTISGEPGSRAAAAGAILSLSIPVWGADSMGEDIDPTVFQNRPEVTQERRENRYWWGRHVTLTQTLDTFTYRSFADATQFFQSINPGTP